MATKTRRAPGAGHLFIRKSGAGLESWYGKWTVEGRQIKRKIGPKRAPGGAKGLTRAEAERALRRLMEDDNVAPSERLDVSTAGRRLIDHLEAMGRKKATTEAYDSLLRIHLTPFFAGRSLDAIRPEDLEAFIRKESADGSSAKTIRNALGFLHSIYERGQRRGWARSNPCKLVDKPRDPHRADIRFLSNEELEATVRAEEQVDDILAPTLALIYRTAGMTGLRQGELIGLRWRDVDWPASKIRVRQAYVRGEVTTPKSARSVRSVPMADELAGLLDRHHSASRWMADDHLVFAHPVLGRPLDRTKVRKRFKAALKAGGVREVRFHDLRHTFGTRMAGVGVPMRTLQEWMGHRDSKTTEIYADYQPSQREREWVEEAFRAPSRACLQADMADTD